MSPLHQLGWPLCTPCCIPVEMDRRDGISGSSVGAWGNTHLVEAKFWIMDRHERSVASCSWLTVSRAKMRLSCRNMIVCVCGLDGGIVVSGRSATIVSLFYSSLLSMCAAVTNLFTPQQDIKYIREQKLSHKKMNISNVPQEQALYQAKTLADEQKSYQAHKQRQPPSLISSKTRVPAHLDRSIFIPSPDPRSASNHRSAAQKPINHR